MVANHQQLESLLQSNESLSNLDHRHHERVFADTGIVAEVTLLNESEPKHTFKALVVDGSFSGCGIVAVTDHKIDLGQQCLLTIEELGQMPSTVIWLEPMGTNLLRIGLAYQI